MLIIKKYKNTISIFLFLFSVSSYAQKTAEEYFLEAVPKYFSFNFKGAIKDLDMAIELKPDYAGAYSVRGFAKFKSDDYIGAILDLNRAIELKLDSIDVYYFRAFAKSMLKDYRGAIKDYNKVIEVRPDDVEAYGNRGVAKHNLKDYKGALQDYSKVIELKPDFLDTYLSRAAVKFMLEDYRGTIQDYNKAIELKPDHAEAYYHRGIAYLMIDFTNKACRDVKKARELGYIAANNMIEDFCDQNYENAIQSPSFTWQIDSGLYYAEFESPIKSMIGTSIITILKINPRYYNLVLVSAKETKEENKTAKEWAKAKGLIAVINAGMFQQDHKTNAGYMKNYDFINSGYLNKYNTITAFNRKDTTVPEFQIIDLKCQNWEKLKEKYHSYIQGIRMIDCNQKNKWSQQDRKWSMVVIGMDKQGNALFIFTRSPYSVHDFINILLKLPINIYNAMYLEGGPEASFYLDYNGVEIQKFGSYETWFNENDDNNAYWKIPNVIGIVKKE